MQIRVSLIHAIGAIVLVMLVVAEMASSAQLANSPWPMFRQNGRRTGVSAYTGPTNSATLTTKWNFSTTGFMWGPITLGPTGIMYAGSNDKSMYAINSNTGTLIFNFSTGGTVQSSATISSDGTIYFGSADYLLYALDAVTAAVKWTFNTTGQVKSSPTLSADGNTVYVSTAGKAVLAVNAATGALVWNYTAPNSVLSSPTITSDGTLLVGCSDFKLYALNAATGAFKWSFTTGGIIDASPALNADETVTYIGSYDNKLYAVNVATGAMVWNFSVGAGNIRTSAAVGNDGTVYFGQTVNRFFAINGATGAMKWNYTAGGAFVGSPAIGADNTVYCGCRDGRIYAWDGATGTLKFSTPQFGDWVDASIAIGSDGVLFSGTDKKFAFALTDATAATPAPTAATPAPTAATPAPTAATPAPTAATPAPTAATPAPTAATPAPTAATPAPTAATPAPTATPTAAPTPAASTPAPTPSSGVCDTPPPRLDVPKSSSTGGNLTLSITSSITFTSVVTVFDGASLTGVCASTANPTWWYNAGVTGCYRTMTITAAINDMIANCNFQRDETDAETTVFGSTIIITTVQDAGSVRDVPVTFTSTTSVRVHVGFKTAINATSGALQIFGPAISYAQIVHQTMNISPTTTIPSITLRLITSSQYPYQLMFPLIDQVTDFTATIVAITADPVSPTASICNATGEDSFAAGSTCVQLWTIVITPANPCPQQSNFNHLNWAMRFQIRCHSSFTGSCATPDPSNITVLFDTASAEYCPQLVTNDATATAILTTYMDSSHVTPQNQFVWGTRTYFRMDVTAPIGVSDVNIERVTIVSGAASGVSNLYSKPFTSATTYFGTAGSYVSNANQNPTLMTVDDSNGGAVSFTRTVNFSWVWSQDTSGATGDVAMPTTVQVAARIRFASVSTVSHRLVTAVLHRPRGAKSGVLAADEVASTSASTAVGVTGGEPIVGEGSAGTEMSGTAMMAAGVVAAGCALVIIVAGVLVYKKIKSSKAQHRDSVELRTSSSMNSLITPQL